MDAVQFGRWVGERRRTLGWNSQRALVEAACNDAYLNKSGISEDFLARLEAGNLAHPFRGSVRQRVLALAWLLCKTAQDVRTYLRVAELNVLSAEENEQVEQLKNVLTVAQKPSLLLLPPRPPRFVGRTDELHALSNALCAMRASVYAITGMAGIGKSALAFEVVHQLAANERERRRLFPDGIVMLTCTDRRGNDGLLALLREITALFRVGGNEKTGIGQKHERRLIARGHVPRSTPTSELAQAMNEARAALSQKRVLLLLDDIEADFPLREALHALLAQNITGVFASGHEHNEHVAERRVILLTSRAIFPPALVSYHQHLAPLSAEAAYSLLATFIGQSSAMEEREYREYIEQICVALGNLPRAIEVAANALVTRRIPLALLAERVTQYPLDTLLDSDGEIHAILAQSLEVLAPMMQEQFALLSILGTSSFELEQAAALHVPSLGTEKRQALEEFVNGHDGYDGQGEHAIQREIGVKRGVLPLYLLQSSVADDADAPEFALETVAASSTRLLRTAADLGLFVQRSLLEYSPEHYTPVSLATATVYESLQQESTASFHNDGSSRYRMHPLLRATALERLRYLDETAIDMVQSNIQQYALDLLERYQSDMPRLEREREFLLTALKQAWHLEQYDIVIRLVEGMSCIMGQMDTSNEGVRVLLWGIHASRLRRNRYQQAHFLNHLGTLFCYRGELAFARRALEESLEIADELGNYAHLSQPLCNLAHIAHLLEDYEAAQRYADAYLQRMQQFGDTCKLPVALFIHGFYSRLQGEQDRAFEDLHTAIHLFSQQDPPASYAPDPYDHIFALDMQAEFARASGDYSRSQAYIESAIAIINQTNDSYGIVDRLYDQATFAYQHGAYNDARALAQRAVDMATRINSPRVRLRSMQLLQQIAETVQM